MGALSVVALEPRLGDLAHQQATRKHLSLDMIDRLTQQGELRRVQLTLGDRTVPS